MSPQLVDMNDDGYPDVLCGSFSGIPKIIMGSKDGFDEPVNLVDKNGDPVLISAYWDDEEDRWADADRSQTDGHCTSVAAVDWDDDGDLDLILGGYYKGGLFLRRNEGTSQDPQFAVINEVIEQDGEPLVIEKGLATPRVVDWNGDEKFDILCGGSKGGVFLFTNRGEKGKPKFEEKTTLIPPFDDPSNSFIKRVPTRNSQPTLPGSSYHVDVFDYDQDGDLDLLVGARSSWLVKVKEITEEEKAVVAELEEEMKKASAGLRTLITENQGKELSENEDYRKSILEIQKLRRKISELKPNPQRSGDFIWLFRRK